MSHSIRLGTIGLVVAVSTALFAADQKEPAKESAGQVIGESREQTLKPVTFAHITVKTSIQKIGDTARDGFEKLAKLMKDNNAFPAGPPMLISHGATQDPAAEFTLDIGYIVADDAKGGGELKVEKLEKFHCSSVLYTGPADKVSAAYEKVYGDLSKAGHQPTTEAREMFLYWEGADSPNNVMQVSAGIQ